MASVKWLRRLIVTSEPFNGYYQSLDYSFWDRGGPLPTLAPLSEQQVKAEIARPENGATVPANSTVKVHGAAWSCDADITKVEISVDSGVTWDEAKLLDDSVKNAWRLWEYEWRTPARPGKQTLLARATDSRGRVQPLRTRHRSRHLHDQSCSAHRGGNRLVRRNKSIAAAGSARPEAWCLAIRRWWNEAEPDDKFRFGMRPRSLRWSGAQWAVGNNIAD